MEFQVESMEAVKISTKEKKLNPSAAVFVPRFQYETADEEETNRGYISIDDNNIYSDNTNIIEDTEGQVNSWYDDGMSKWPQISSGTDLQIDMHCCEETKFTCTHPGKYEGQNPKLEETGHSLADIPSFQLKEYPSFLINNSSYIADNETREGQTSDCLSTCCVFTTNDELPENQLRPHFWQNLCEAIIGDDANTLKLFWPCFSRVVRCLSTIRIDYAKMTGI